MSTAEAIQLGFGAATAPVAAAFIWLYARDPWWRTWFGRSLMLLAVSVLCFSGVVVMYRLYGPDYIGRDFLLIASSGGTFAAMLIRTVVLWRVQHHERRHRDEIDHNE